jgi:hypothetical protein
MGCEAALSEQHYIYAVGLCITQIESKVCNLRLKQPPVAQAAARIKD